MSYSGWPQAQRPTPDHDLARSLPPCAADVPDDSPGIVIASLADMVHGLCHDGDDWYRCEEEACRRAQALVSVHDVAAVKRGQGIGAGR